MIQNPKLYVEGRFERILYPVNLSLTLNLTPLSTASMTLQQGDFLPPRSYVEIFTPYGSAGFFRVRNPQSSYGNTSTTCELEHMVSEVGDYLYKGKIDEMMNAAEAVKKIFKRNSATSGGYGGRLWALGDVSVLDDNTNKVAVEVEYDNVLDAILGILEQKPDIMMTFDFYNRQTWVINFEKKPTAVKAEGRLSRNVTSARISYDDSDLCTRVWYQTYTTSGGKTTSTWNYKDDIEAVEDYGLVERTVSTSSDMTDAEIKTTWQTYLREHNKPKVSVEISAIELSRITGAPLDQFTLGKMLRLALPDYGITVERNISTVTWSALLADPDHYTINMGDDEDTVVTFLHNLDSSGSGSSAGGSSSKKTKSGINEATDTAKNGIYALQITGPTNNKYTLQKKSTNDTGWVTVGNFSRAVTSWTVTASNGTITVTAKPQEQSKKILIKAADGSWSGNIYKGNIQYSSNNGSSYTNTGKQYSVDATARYNAGSANVNLSSWWSNSLPYDGDIHNKITVKTTGRVNTRGSSENLTREYDIYVTSGNNTAYARLSGENGAIIAANTHNRYNAGSYNVNLVTEWGTAIPQIDSDHNNLTVRTTNRVTESGSAANLSFNHDIYVTSGNNTAYARLDATNGTILAAVNHNRYNAGSYNVTLSTVWTPSVPQNSQAYVNLKVSTVNRVTESGTAANLSFNHDIYVTSGNNTAYARLDGESGTIIAALTHNKFNAGSYNVNISSSWSNAIPYNGGSSNKLTVTTTNRVNNSGTAANVKYEHTFYLTSGDNTAYIRLDGTSGTIVAALTHNKYKEGQATQPSSVNRKSTGITGTSAGDVSAKTGNYVTFNIGSNAYYIKIA